MSQLASLELSNNLFFQLLNWLLGLALHGFPMREPREIWLTYPKFLEARDGTRALSLTLSSPCFRLETHSVACVLFSF